MNEEEIDALQRVFNYINIPIDIYLFFVPSKLFALYLWTYIVSDAEKAMAIRKYLQYRSTVKRKMIKTFITIMATVTIEQFIIFLLSKYCVNG